MTPTHKALTPAGEWVEGWFDYSSVDAPVIWISGETYFGSNRIVLHETVCRATGRPDSNGKMMYEGDYVKVHKWIDVMKGYSGIYRIEYNIFDCAFCLVDDNKSGEDMAINFNVMDNYILTGKNINNKTEGK